MSMLNEIISNLKNVKGYVDDIKVARNSVRGTSLARMSSAATLQFPIIVSKSITMDSTQSVSKAFERQYANFVQIVISLNPYLDLSKDENMTQYLRKIHQNEIGSSELLESCTNVLSDEAYGLSLFMSINSGSNSQIVSSNKSQLFSVEECLNQYKVNDLYKPEKITMSVAESSFDYYCKKNHIVTEAIDDDIDNAADKLALDKILAKRRLQDEAERNRQRSEDDSRDYKHKTDMDRKRLDADNDRELYRREVDRKRFENELSKAEIEARSKAVVKLSDNDVKKANELVPTTLSVTMMVKDKQSFGGNQNFVIGVKGLIHPVNSNDMISNLLDGHKSGNKFFNFIRWTTGEISFLKDLLLNIDGIKEDVVKKYTGGSHWWTTLKRRKTIARTKNAFGKGKLLPNASIVCSMEEVMELKDSYGLDLLAPKNIKRIMDRYFLLGFAIVDEAQELCHFIFDGENDYQVVSFKGLEKENNSKNDFKDIYKMINSGRL